MIQPFFSIHHPTIVWLWLALIPGIFWLKRYRVTGLLGLVACWIILLSYELFVLLPTWQIKLQASIPKKNSLQNQQPTWIQGRVLNWKEESGELKLHLEHVFIEHEGESSNLYEAQVFLEAKKSRASIYRGKWIQVSGWVSEVQRQAGQLHLRYGKYWRHGLTPPQDSWQRKLAFYRQHLAQRAAFYLSPEALALYQPLTLAQSTYHQKIRQLFQESGMVHLLVISGLHIGLLFGLLWFGMRQFGGWTPLRSWVHFPSFCRLMPIALLWIYIAFIGFPTPALRAIVMLSFWMLARSIGIAQSPVYILLLTAMSFLIINPTQLYQLSFQLSFLATLYILLPWKALSLKTPEGFVKKIGFSIYSSVLVTTLVMIGIGPLLLSTFHYLSLEGFWLNLIMIPLLAFVILPVCFGGLLVSLFHFQGLPFSWMEEVSFYIIQWVLELWLDLFQVFHSLGAGFGLTYAISWEAWQYLLYYALTLAVGLLFVSLEKKKLHFRA